jgi:hypothetical protein
MTPPFLGCTRCINMYKHNRKHFGEKIFICGYERGSNPRVTNLGPLWPGGSVLYMRKHESKRETEVKAGICLQVAVSTRHSLVACCASVGALNGTRWSHIATGPQNPAMLIGLLLVISVGWKSLYVYTLCKHKEQHICKTVHQTPWVLNLWARLVTHSLPRSFPLRKPRGPNLSKRMACTRCCFWLKVVKLGKVQEIKRTSVASSAHQPGCMVSFQATLNFPFLEPKHAFENRLRMASRLSVVAACVLSSDGACVCYKKVTWLILPVVICLSQRLSHACLSINIFILWNCVQLIISVIIYLMVTYYMDNRSNSRANTCVKSRLFIEEMYLLVKKPMQVSDLVLWWIIVTVRIAWLHAGDSSFKFLPYQLSTVV